MNGVVPPGGRRELEFRRHICVEWAAGLKPAAVVFGAHYFAPTKPPAIILLSIRVLKLCPPSQLAMLYLPIVTLSLPIAL